MDADAQPQGTSAEARKGKRSEVHVLELDGLRGIAILTVMAAHFLGMILKRPQNSLEFAIAKVVGYGMWGVDLFFVLSGFLITGILWDSKESPRYFKSFYMRRTLRIFPLYYGVLLVWIVLIPRSWLAAYLPEALEMREAQIWLWTYLTNVYVAPKGDFELPYVAHFWTLSIEEHFYLFWPLVIRLSSRANAMRAAIALSVLALGLRLLFNQIPGKEFYGHVLTPCRLDSLCIGAWFALAIRGPAGADALGRNLWRWVLGTSGLMLALVAIPASLLPKALGLPVKQTALALLCASIVFAGAWSGGPPRLKRFLRIGILRILGKYSYGLYVFHTMVAYGLWYHGTVAYFEHALGSHTLAVFAQASFGAVVSFLIAYASYNFFEVRFLALKRWFEA